MSLKIRWTTKAEQALSEIVDYPEEKWSSREVKMFVQKVDRILIRISYFPYLLEASSFRRSVRKAIASKQCTLFHEVREDHIVLLLFWDNRRKPLSSILKPE